MRDGSTDRGDSPDAHLVRLLDAAWSAPGAHEVLQAIAEGVTEVLGFGVAAVSVVRDNEVVEVVAVAGNEDARAHLMGARNPLADLRTELSVADAWGTLRFVPHDRLPAEVTLGWVPDVEPTDDPGAWHPLDLLVAPLLDQDGTMRGLLAVDLPAGGRRPDAETRLRLERYAAQAARALVAALEREALHEQVRLAAATRAIVRAASARLDLSAIVRECQQAIFEGLRVDGFWLHVLGPDGAGRQGPDATGAAGAGGEASPAAGFVVRDTGETVELPDDIVEIATAAAEASWHRQVVTVICRGRPASDLITPAQHARVLDHLDRRGVASVMFVPLGAGSECLGSLVLTRWESTPDWTDIESAAALDIGRDLGRAVLNARIFEREHRLVSQLRAVAGYRAQLVATLAHELRTPLTALMGHTELLMDDDPGPRARESVAAVHRSAARIDAIVGDLLVLSRVDDPDVGLELTAVDLREVAAEVNDLLRLAAAERGVDLVVDAPGEVVVHGDATLLDRLCQNLVGNAVKYSPAGGRIEVRLRREVDEVVLEVADRGIGIAAAEVDRVFTEFFRSADPAVRAQPGTGLGLAIVERIVRRHHGTIAVASTPGAGSTFTVRLPAA